MTQALGSADGVTISGPPEDRYEQVLTDRALALIAQLHRSFDQPTVEAMASVARAHRLVMTGGSDYHGDLGPYVDSHARLWVPPEIGKDFLAALSQPAG